MAWTLHTFYRSTIQYISKKCHYDRPHQKAFRKRQDSIFGSLSFSNSGDSEGLKEHAPNVSC